MVEMAQTASALDCTQQPNDGAYRLRPTRPAAFPNPIATERKAILTRAVELDVIPRLLRAHGLGRAQAAKSSAIGAPDIALLVELSIAPDEAATTALVLDFQDQGVPTDTIFLDLLAPAAERLGEMWEQDICDFAEVTIGLSRLQRAMRDVGASRIGARFFQPPLHKAGKRVLLLPLPGEQHTFGIAMVLEFFRRAGWHAQSGTVEDAGELMAVVRAEWLDVVGLSLGSDERLETARTLIQAVRLASRNPAVAVMVGGPAFIRDPALAAEIGADGTARDGRQAVQQAQDLVERQAARP